MKHIVLKCSFIIFLGALSYRLQAQTGTINTVAGSGSYGFSGDGGPGTAASFNFLAGIAVDSNDNLYIADGVNNRIRKVSGGGVVTTYGGNGAFSFSGDGGQATAAGFGLPMGVATDNLGNLYVADEYNQRIRKIAPSGIVTTVAGNGSIGSAGDGGPATAANLNYPVAVAVDAAGNIFIADVMNSRIRKVNTSGVISTVAGTGSFGHSGDGGPASAAMLNYPMGMTADVAGNLFIADQNNNCIRKVTAAGTISTIAGMGTAAFSGDGGAATLASLFMPSAVAADGAGNLFIADQFNNRIRRVDAAGTISTVVGSGPCCGIGGFSGDGGPATNAVLNAAYDVVIDKHGNLFVSDSNNNRVREVAGITTSVAGGTRGNVGVVHVYPNPAHTQIIVACAEPANQIEITNLLGQIMLESGSVGKDVVVDISALVPGVYVIRVNGANSGKVVKY